MPACKRPDGVHPAFILLGVPGMGFLILSPFTLLMEHSTVLLQYKTSVVVSFHKTKGPN